MTNTTDTNFIFDVQLDLVADYKGLISAKGIKDMIYVTTPVEFGGGGNTWSPEQLFLSSISSCFLTTYLAFAKKYRFEISHFECKTVGKINLVEGKYKFTYIHLYPRVYVADETLKEKANLALEKTHKYCLVSNSVSASVFFHSEILYKTHPGFNAENSKQHRSTFTLDEARLIGDRIGIDFTKYDLHEFRRGLEVELEHGTSISETNITNDNEYMTGKIAWAHLHEIPDYYTRLDKMEKKANEAA